MSCEFSRLNPSPRYRQLIEIYSGMHQAKPKIFSGGRLRGHLPAIRELVQTTGAESLLDYGSGKGSLYDQRGLSLKGVGTIPSVKEFLGVREIRPYDPCVPQFAAFPAGLQFDGVISTDVLEHIPSADLPWVVEEMFWLSRKFVFAVVASFPARKQLPSGENAHETQKPYWWWRRTIREVAGRHSGIVYHFRIEQDLHIKPLPRRRIVRFISGTS